MVPTIPPPQYSAVVVTPTPLSQPPSPSVSPHTLYLTIAILIVTLLFVAYELYQMAHGISLLRAQLQQLSNQLDSLTQTPGSSHRHCEEVPT
jgi:ABC-type Fe3+ transport system permease subunit